MSWQLPAAQGDEPAGSVAALTLAVERRGGRVLAAFLPQASLIGDHAGSVVLLTQWPDARQVASLRDEPLTHGHARVLQMAAGHPFAIARSVAPPDDLAQALAEDSSEVFLIGAFTLGPNGSFTDCRRQMVKVLDLAGKHGGRLLGSYRVTQVLAGKFSPVLFGIVAWPVHEPFEQFSHALVTRGVTDRIMRRPAHGLQPGQVLLLETRRVPAAR